MRIEDREMVYGDGGFIETVEMQAQWRHEKSAEYPDDNRNLRTAEGLDGLAAWLRRLQDDDPVIVKLGAALNHLYSDPDWAFSFVPSVEDRLARFRFNDDPTRRDFIVRLADEIEAR